MKHRYYTDGKHIATFDECGSLVRFEPVAHAEPHAMTEAIRGTRGREMIAAIRTPGLRRVIRDESGIRITVPM